jgi:hypothetical protein
MDDGLNALWIKLFLFSKTLPSGGFPARSADEKYAFVALLPAILCHVRMNPFILCPGGPNGSS